MIFKGNQKKVIEHGPGTLLVEAGPGSGKTTVIVERIKYLIEQGVDPESFLVITFTIKAAENLKNKLRKDLSNEIVSKMQISTIHSFCLEYLKSQDVSLRIIEDDYSEKKTMFIKNNQKDLGFKGESTIFDYHIPHIIKKFGEYTSFKVRQNDLISHIDETREVTDEYKDFVKSLDYFSKKSIDDADKLKGKDEPKFKDSWYNARYLQIAKAYQKYLDLLKDHNYVDFDTLQSKTLKKLRENPKTRFRTIFVDEFQDTDPLQFRIFEILRMNCDYFTAVGDVDQHIYAFRSSFNDFFDEMIRLYDPDSKSLDINFRSTDSIVQLTEEFINPQRKETSQKHMVSNGKEYDNPNFLLKNENSDDEAKKVYKIIETLKENGQIRDYNDVAILYRHHSDKTISNLIEMFSEGGIDFSIKGQSDLGNQDEVKSIIILLWYITRKTYPGRIPSTAELEEINLKALCGEYFTPSFWSLADSTIEYLTEIQDDFYSEVLRIENEIRKHAGQGRVSAVHRVKKNETQETLVDIFSQVQIPTVDLSRIIDETDKAFFRYLDELREDIESKEPPTILQVFYRLLSIGNIFDDIEGNHKVISNLASLTETMHNYESIISQTDVRGLYYFLKNAVDRYESYQPEGEGVQMMTVHSAKGLEFPVTIVTSIQKDRFPSKPKDPCHKDDFVFPNETYYTPNELLEYKTMLKEKENGDFTHETITLEEEYLLDKEEEDRILYVAMTRAADLLILSSIGEIPPQVESLENLERFTFDDLDNVTIKEHYETPTEKLKLNYSSYSTYKLCPFMYNLIYNFGFRISDENVTNMGSVYHEIMEKINLRFKNGESISNDELIEITDEIYEHFFDKAETIEDYEKLKKSVLEYNEVYAPKFNVNDTELSFEIERENYILNGAVDLIYNISDSEIGILDYKNAEWAEFKTEKYKEQLYVYASALMELAEFKDKDIKEAQIHFVKSDKKPLFEINDDVVDSQLEKLNDVALKIEAEDYPKNKTNFCKECKFKLICDSNNSLDEFYE